MIILEHLEEITVQDVIDRGIANKERIALRVNTSVNLGRYGLLIGIRGSTDGEAWPINDNFFWFGEGIVMPGDWIFVYTGPGQPRKDKLPNTEQYLYTLHWGKKTTVFADMNLVPILFRMDGVRVPLSAARALEKA
jgi:hypothetical protein